MATQLEKQAADAAVERQEAERFEDSFYFRMIGRKIGEELRNRYDVSEPLPDRLTNLLSELDKDLEEPARTEGRLHGPGISGSR
jgi:Anti-sigma factor NepR